MNIYWTVLASLPKVADDGHPARQGEVRVPLWSDLRVMGGCFKGFNTSKLFIAHGVFYVEFCFDGKSDGVKVVALALYIHL